MKLTRRILTTTGWNLLFFAGLPLVFNISRSLKTYGAYHGWWPIEFHSAG